MLTKTDLSNLKKIIRGEVALESKTTRSVLQSEIKLSRMKIQNELNNLNGKIKDLKLPIASNF
ncbi:MAG: hypothetical protein ABII08_04520 [Candidatus Beckwithbacteria bacterium]|nr:hypothetical protein [Patescibacteria group bacterium]